MLSSNQCPSVMCANFAVVVKDEETMVLCCGVDLLEGNSPLPRNLLLGTISITSSSAKSC